MSVIEKDIASTPTILRQTVERVNREGDPLRRALEGPVVFLGSGSSYCVGVAVAALYEQIHGAPAQAILGSDYRSRPEWMHVAISRTGKTSELVEAMRRARDAGARVALVRGDGGSPAEAQADIVLPLEFAAEEGIIQTRFITAATAALRLIAGDATARQLPERMERGLAEFDPAPLIPYGHVVFLGRGWCHGLALSARLNLAETALMVAEAHQTLDYRHGPIATADEGTLVWCFDPIDDADSGSVVEDARRTGATVRWTGDDPLVSLAQAQILAVRLARARGVDPEAPRNLTRAIVLPEQ